MELLASNSARVDGLLKRMQPLLRWPVKTEHADGSSDAQQLFHGRHDTWRLNWLGDVGICPQAKRALAILTSTFGRDHDDRCVLVGRVHSDSLDQLQPIHDGH